MSPALLASVTRGRDEAREQVRVLREALEPFAALNDGSLPEPHPCAEHCDRIGEAAAITDGVCDECGLRSHCADEVNRSARITYGDIRRARAALASTTDAGERRE